MKSRSSFIVVLLMGCVFSSALATSAANTAHLSPALANGSAIFHTGRDLHGTRIAAQPRAMMPSCEACHRADGSGGLHLPGGAVSADLRHHALVTAQKPPYTLALVERAISRGIDNTGAPLHHVMPHWRLSQTDLHDVAEYVLTELK
jgi:mono/diheme cytochrome c family protein